MKRKPDCGFTVPVSFFRPAPESASASSSGGVAAL